MNNIVICPSAAICEDRGHCGHAEPHEYERHSESCSEGCDDDSSCPTDGCIPVKTPLSYQVYVYSGIAASLLITFFWEPIWKRIKNLFKGTTI